MPVTIQQGQTGAFQLVFKEGTTVVVPPTSGGAVSVSPGGILGVSMDPDEKTIHLKAVIPGTATVTYTGPNGMTATDVVTVVATLANSAAIDETTYVSPDPDTGNIAYTTD